MIPIEWSEEGRPQFVAAYAKAQAEMGKVEKGATNTHFSTKYATLAAVISAVVPPMAANGLAVLQSPSFDGEVLTVETIVMHAEGGWIKSNINVRPGKPDAQGLGSAITYLRRYALMSLAGVAPEDDDGNAASVSGEGGKKFDRPQSKAADVRIEGDTCAAVIKEMRMMATEGALRAWGDKNVARINALGRKGAEEVQLAYTRYKDELEAKGAAPPADTRQATATKSLADRAFHLAAALKACVDVDALRRTYEAGKLLRDDLDKHDPERLVEINALFEGLYATLPAMESV